jgi:hypothetical protein
MNWNQVKEKEKKVMTEPGKRYNKEEKEEMRASQNKPEELLQSLEGHLQTSLHPVAPNPEFISKLRNRLVTPDVLILEKEPRLLSLLVVIFGLLSGIAILMLGKRAIVIIAAGIGIMVSRWRKRNTPISI